MLCTYLVVVVAAASQVLLLVVITSRIGRPRICEACRDGDALGDL